MEVAREMVEQMILQILEEKLGQEKTECVCRAGFTNADGVIKAALPQIKTGEADRLDTGNPGDVVYTHDLFSLTESPRLGCGIMEMEETTFDWTLTYDEIDYVIEGSLTVVKNGKSVTAGAGEAILIPKGSVIQFSVPGKARFMYVTYPADWAGQV